MARSFLLLVVFVLHIAQTCGFSIGLRNPIPLKVQRRPEISKPVFLVASSHGGNAGLPPSRWWARSNVAGGWSSGEEEKALSDTLLSLSLVAKFSDSYVVARAKYRRRVVTNFFLITNLCVFLLQAITQGAILEAGAKVNTMITVYGQYYRFFTPMFLHVGVLHLLVNSFSLNAVGPQVESMFGSERTAVTYLLAGVAGNVASFLLSPSASSVGASGAIFGLVGALGVFLWRHEELLGAGSRAGLNSILQTCALNLMIGLIPGSQIDNWGHIGGAIGGAAVAFLIGPNFKMQRSLMGNKLVDEPLVPLPFAR